MKNKTLTLETRASKYLMLAMTVALATQLTACGNGQSGGASNDTGVATDSSITPAEDAADMGNATVPESSTVAVSVPASNGLTVKILGEKSVTAAQSQKLKTAVSALNQVVNSVQLREQILNFTYNGAKQFYQNNGLTNEQIYASFMAGAEKYPTQAPANNIADMYISTYFPPWWKVTSAVAFTSSTDPYLNIYNSYFNSSSVADLANTIFHEWTHKLGYTHDFNATAARPYSVPYGVGNLVRAAVTQYLGK
jgi:hypothetical protein